MFLIGIILVDGVRGVVVLRIGLFEVIIFVSLEVVVIFIFIFVFERVY